MKKNLLPNKTLTKKPKVAAQPARAMNPLDVAAAKRFLESFHCAENIAKAERLFQKKEMVLPDAWPTAIEITVRGNKMEATVIGRRNLYPEMIGCPVQNFETLLETSSGRYYLKTATGWNPARREVTNQLVARYRAWRELPESHPTWSIREYRQSVSKSRGSPRWRVTRLTQQQAKWWLLKGQLS